MKKEAIIRKQLEMFERMLVETESCTDTGPCQKCDRLLGVQVCMYVFTHHMDDSDAERFEALYKGAFKRVMDAWEVKG